MEPHQNPYLASIGVTQTPSRKRSAMFEYSTPGTSYITDSSVSASATASRKRKRVYASQEDRHLEELQWTTRYNHFEYVGKQKGYARLHMKPSVAEACEFFSEFMQFEPVPLPDFDPEEKVFVRSNSLVQLNHLDRFNHPPFERPAELEDVIGLAASYVDYLLELPFKLSFPTVSDLDNVRFYGDKFAGVEYARTGLKTRSEANDVASIDAEQAWNKLMRGERVQPHLNRIGGRGKVANRVDVDAAGDKLDKGRLVMMTSQRDLKLNGVTEQVLTNAYKPSEYPLGVGVSWWHGGCEEFLGKLRGFQRYWCLDAKKFDASLPGWLIRIAINILRNQYDDGMNAKYDTYWQYIYEGMCEAPMFIDNGYIFRRRDGSTSGHSHNTLIQSICTIILGYAAFLRIKGVENADRVFEALFVCGLGDDNLMGGTDYLADVTVEQLAEAVWAIARVDWGGVKSFATGRLVDENQGDFESIQYLGKFFREIDVIVNSIRYSGVVPYRPTDETIVRLLYPEHYAEGVNAAWERACGHYADSAGNDVTREYLEKYLDWLEPQVTSPQFGWTEKFKRKFTLGSPHDDLPVPSRRLTYSEWLDLVLNP